jgi:transcriptional regulator with XRE-family HTH domain
MVSQRVGVNIKRLREANGWSQEQLAKKAKLRRVSLAKMEVQTITPTLPTLDRIAKALGVKTAELLG